MVGEFLHDGFGVVGAAVVDEDDLLFDGNVGDGFEDGGECFFFVVDGDDDGEDEVVGYDEEAERFADGFAEEVAGFLVAGG